MLEREPLRPVYLKELVKGVTLASYRERQRLWGGGGVETDTSTTSACPVVVLTWDLCKGSYELIHAKQWREQDGITCQLLIPVCLCVCVSDRLGLVAVCGFLRLEVL